MFFSRCHSLKPFTYHLNNYPIKFVGDLVRDLGFTLIRTLCPNKHFMEICCKSFKVFGFVLCVYREFNLVLPLKMLYCAIVCFILEYGMILWNPSTATASNMIEHV